MRRAPAGAAIRFRPPNPPKPTATDLVSAGPPRLARAVLVENTGIEPVTSWLQTRRSPS